MRAVLVSLVGAVVYFGACTFDLLAADVQPRPLERKAHEALVSAGYEQCFTGWWLVYKRDQYQFRPRWGTRCRTLRSRLTARYRAPLYR